MSNGDIWCEIDKEGRVEAIIRNQVVRVGFTEKEILEQRPERGEGGRHVRIWEKSLPNTGINKCKGPGAGMCLVSLKRSKGAAGERLATAIGQCRDEGGSVTFQLVPRVHHTFSSQ